MTEEDPKTTLSMPSRASGAYLFNGPIVDIEHQVHLGPVSFNSELCAPIRVFGYGEYPVAEVNAVHYQPGWKQKLILCSNIFSEMEPASKPQPGQEEEREG